MKSFKSEAKRVLDLMINSIYTNKEIFLRELISNASDAIDKLYYKSLSGGITGLSREDFYIRITPDKAERTLTIEDNGIGMTAEELDKNLGTIAKSGSLDFKNEAKEGNLDIIGQFGVGFYSAFMVAKRVEVTSRAFGSDEANVWTSDGAEGYSVAKAQLPQNGTVVKLYLKEDEEGEYDKFCEEYALRQLIKKYSDYIRYPVQLLCKHDHYDDEGNVTESHEEYQTVNTMTPLWKKSKKEITEEEYDGFYATDFHDGKPLAVIHTSAEGAVEYKALLFIPSHAPYNYYTKSYEKGLKLYTNGVLISERMADLLPDYYSFVKGLVDCELSLNISRETVQQNRQLKRIANNIEKKITDKLKDMLQNEREKYEEFFGQFGLQLKYGMYTDWGMHKDLLKDLVMFRTVKEGKYMTFTEYVAAMPEGQENIYYATGKTAEAVRCLPQCDKILSEGKDILCLTDDIDEFVLRILDKYEDKPFKSVSDEVAASEDADATEEDKQMFAFMKQHLPEEVAAVRGTNSLGQHPVCLTTQGDLSIEMEKVLGQMPGEEAVKAQKVLEINRQNALFGKLRDWYLSDKETLEKATKVLYQQARIIEGLPVDNAADYARLVCEFLAK